MIMGDALMLTRKDVLQALGISKTKLRTLVEAGVLAPVHLVIDETGRPRDRALFKRGDVEAIVGRRINP
jgi:hypothetical protein